MKEFRIRNDFQRSQYAFHAQIVKPLQGDFQTGSMSTLRKLKSMQIEVNGQKREVLPGTNILDILSQFNIPEQRVAVELNLSIIDRKQFSQISLNEGDKMEIINFVGGG
jgi:thiamine biosynthesis protein ThiS